MAFTQASAPFRARTAELLSADNGNQAPTAPERHIIIELLRQAAPLLALPPSAMATLEVMLSCLPPKRTHNTVFASNNTLSFRRNGITDRTIRRHAAILIDAGFIARNDSPNGKRFSRHSAAAGTSLRFGFDLSPLFDRLQELSALAAAAERQREKIAYLRTKLRAAANELLRQNPDAVIAQEALKALRRKLDIASLETLIEALPTVRAEAVYEQPTDPQSTVQTIELSAKDSQNVRHYQKSKKENTDKKESNVVSHSPTPEDSTPLTIAELLTACPEANQFSLRPVETLNDVVAHAQTLAPMIGIDRANYTAAQNRIGAISTALTIWAIMQFHTKISKVGAYFRSITSGARSEGFDVTRLIRRLGVSRRALHA